jgi:sigma-B regulation protein RsbU (phosphoserine phosphatase)
MKTITVPAVLESLPRLISFLGEFADENKFPQPLRMQLELAVEEAVVNVVNYAYQDKESGTVELSCGMDSGSAVISIADEGAHFDVSQKPDPDVSAPVETRKIGGLGIFLIKQMMDETFYQRKDGKNILTLKKKPA